MFRLDPGISLLPDWSGGLKYHKMGMVRDLRRLVVDLSVPDLRKNEPTVYDKIESFEVLHYLRCDYDNFAGVCRIVLRDRKAKPEDLTRLRGEWWTRRSRIKILSKEKGSYVVYVEVGARRTERRAPGVNVIPVELRDERLTMVVLGEAIEVRRFLRELDTWRVKYSIRFLGSATFEPNSPVSTLTERQKRIIHAAYEHGYYEIPRRITSEGLARAMGIDKSTVAEHLRKAENRLLTQVLVKQG
ncbi:MAG: helix-turn-helix domain-containing protein [Thaumarchaeota archaeon]|nr:helix-turn-helix domain-containing protein [Nitrososphaerota archaeon]